MMNQIRADFYRQRRTLGMYVIVLITIAYAVWSVTSKNVGSVWRAGRQYDGHTLTLFLYRGLCDCFWL